jgi:sugar phosphate isomerase/epimerase
MKKIDLSRRQFIGTAVATAAGLVLGTKSVIGAPSIIKNLAGPNSKFKGVQIGVTTYSYRAMPDQSAEAMLKYIVDSGISAVELRGDVGERYAGIPVNPNVGRGAAPQNPTADQQKQREEMMAAQAAYTKQVADWRASVSMDKFTQIKKMYKDAGVSIYAYKPIALQTTNTDAEVDYAFNAAKALGATHVTVEFPTSDADTLRLGKAAERHKLLVAYHTHQQGSMTVFDTAFSQSPNNRGNVDIGHYVAAPGGGDPIPFLEKFHDKLSSIHLKDRTKAGGNLEWGTGETPIVQALQLMRDKKYNFPATIELEYKIPEGSDPVKEVAKCVAYCKKALEA